jgi:hypothetical protein
LLAERAYGTIPSVHVSWRAPLVAWLAWLAPLACAHPVPHPPSCPADCPRLEPPSVQAPRAPAASFVHREGLGVVDERGHPLQLRGVNLGGWLVWEGWIWGGGLKLLHPWGQSESAIEQRLAEAAGTDALCSFREAIRDRFVTEADIAAIAAAGFDVVRVPLDHRDFACDASPGWAVVDRLLDWCEAHGVYAVLDLHSAPGGQTKFFVADPEPVLLWDSGEAQDRTVALWGAIARRYAGRSAVAGYDLLNEPRPPDPAALVALYRRIVDAIRAVDRGHMLVVEGADFARDFSMFSAPLDDDQIYSFHMYTWFGDDRVDRLRGYARVAAAQGVPMWCGEFGENTTPMIASTLDLFDQQIPGLVGWSFWTWKRTATSRWAPLQGIDPPPAWKRLIEWAVNDSGARPAPSEAQGALRDFVDAAQVDRLTSDAELTRVLSTHAAQRGTFSERSAR